VPLYRVDPRHIIGHGLKAAKALGNDKLPMGAPLPQLPPQAAVVAEEHAATGDDIVRFPPLPHDTDL
jgi:hypothetical protein